MQQPKETGREHVRRVLRYLVTIALLAGLCIEAYYIFVLRETIQRQTEDMRSISMQLQLLKSERERLNEEISSTKKRAGEEDNGDTTQR
jgi:cell division protein FtsB